MLIIRPIQDKEKQAEYCSRCDVAYLPEALAYAAWDGEVDSAEADCTFLGVCQFTLKDGACQFRTLCSPAGIDDEEALIIMAYAAMSFIEKCGISDAYIEENVTAAATLAKLGFCPTETGDAYYMNLTEYFNAPCAYKQKLHTGE